MIGGQYEDNQDNRNIPEYVRALPVQILYVYSGKSRAAVMLSHGMCEYFQRYQIGRAHV